MSTQNNVYYANHAGSLGKNAPNTKQYTRIFSCRKFIWSCQEKALRYRIDKEVKPGVLDQEGFIRDASSLVPDWDNNNLTLEKLNEVKQIDPKTLPLVEINDGIAPCICKKSVGKFICIGLNYSDHAEGQHLPIRKEPIVFF